MKYTKILLTFFTFIFSMYCLAQVGINTTNPQGALDVVSTDSGIIVPRVNNTSDVTTPSPPSPGTVVYDLFANCIKVYEDGAWSDCMQKAPRSRPILTPDCNAIGFEEDYYLNGSISTKFSVVISNNGYSDANLSFSSSDLILSGDGVGTLTVGTPTPTTGVVASQDQLVIEYPITGNPVVGSLIGSWSVSDASCSETVSIVKGSANFSLPYTANIVSYLDANNPSNDIQGVIDNGPDNILVISVPYQNGQGSCDAYTSTDPIAVTEEGGASYNLTYSYQGIDFSSNPQGNLDVTIIVDGDGSFDVKKQNAGSSENIATLPLAVNGIDQGNLLIDAIGGIRDKMYDQLDNAGNYSHQFIYLPIVAEDGRTWLNNNLGAEYADVSNPNGHFNLAQQATAHSGNAAYEDFLAFGSLFQWGRKPDGHEVLRWISPSATNGTEQTRESSTKVDEPNHADFLTVGYNNWRENPDYSAWDLNAPNNPCPTNYRLPTKQEFDYYISVTSSPSYSQAALLNLALTKAPLRNNTDGDINDSWNMSLYWTNEQYIDNGANAIRLLSTSGGGSFGSSISMGYSVRCIEEQ